MASRLVSRIATLYLLAGRVPLEMDLFARARILEVAGGLPKWSLSGSPRTFLTEGPPRFPDVDPEWFSPRDTGLADMVQAGAWKVLGDVATGEATAEEIVQNMISGFAIGGGSRDDVYEEIGNKFGREILSGKTGPKAYKTKLFGYAQNRALDVWRKKMRHKKEREKSNPSLVGPTSLREVPAEVAIDRTPNEVMLSLISGPMGRKFRQWLHNTIMQKATDVQKIIYEASIDHLARTGDWPSANDIRDRVIEVKGSPISIRKINDHRNKIEAIIANEMQGNPQVLDWAERYLDLSQLGYGAGQLRSAKRVAKRFLEGRKYRLSPDEQSDVDLERWQKDVGSMAVAAIKRLPHAKSVQKYTVNRDGAVVINAEFQFPTSYEWDDLDKYEQMDLIENRELWLTSELGKALKPIMGSGRAHDQYGGFYLTEDYIFGGSSDGLKWQIEIHPNLAR